MKKQESGNGVKVAKETKVIRDVKSIINDPNHTRKEKISALNRFDFSGRPGKDEAMKIAETYKKRFSDFSSRKITGKYPRGEERIGEKVGYGYEWKIRPSWANAFERHLRIVSPNFSFVTDNLLAIIREVDPTFGYGRYNWNRYRPYANKIRAKAIEISDRIERMNAKKKAFTEQTGLGSEFFGKQRSIADVQENKACNAYKAQKIFCTVAGWNITVWRDETEDWEAYSKSWHNSHGPKRTIDRRYVVFKKGSERKEYDLTSFAGNYLFTAIIETLGVQKPECKEVRKQIRNFQAVQLSPYFDVRILHKVGNVAICERLFAGEHYDYAATDSINTYHSEKEEELIRGLRRKIRLAKERLENPDDFVILTAKYCRRKWRFCWQGMRAFAALNGLDINGEYSLKEIRNAVIAHSAENCARFASELRTIGITLNCK